MPKLSAIKIEQLAIEKIANIVGSIKNATHTLKTNDREVTFDGQIIFYTREGTDAKKYYDYSVDVQVKGRSRNNKKPISVFHLDVSDLRIMQKRGGAILFIVAIHENGKKTVSYAQLLPYDLEKYIKYAETNQLRKAPVKLKAIDEDDEPEMLFNICKSFNMHKSLQIKAPNIAFKHDNEIPNEAVMLIESPYVLFDIKSKLNNETYIYKFDKNQIPSQIRKVIIDQAEIRNSGVALLDLEKKYCFNLNAKITKETTILHYRDVFEINLTNSTFSYKIKGTLSERIKYIDFIKTVIFTNTFYINEYKINPNLPEIEIININKLSELYSNFSKNITKLRISKDPNLDKWNADLITRFVNTTNDIINEKCTNTGYDKTFFATFKVADLNLTYLHVAIEKGEARLYDILSFDDERHKIELSYEDYKTDNILLSLTENKYKSDNFSVEIAEKYLHKKGIKKEESPFFTYQVLHLIRAFDSTNEKKYLEFAKMILKKQKAVSKASEILINDLQIEVRLKNNIDNYLEELLNIRDQTNNQLIKICCNILVQNKKEAKLEISKLDSESRMLLESFPIYKLL